MKINLQELKNAASNLPTNERADLAQFLLHSLDEQDEEGAEAEWLEFAQRRAAEMNSGEVTGIPAEGVLKNLLRPTK